MAESPGSPTHLSASGPDIIGLEDVGPQTSGGSGGGSPQYGGDTVTSVPPSPPRPEGEDSPSQPPTPPDSSAPDSSAPESSAPNSSPPQHSFSAVPLKNWADSPPDDAAFIGPAAPPVKTSVAGPEVNMDAVEEEEVPASPPSSATVTRGNGVEGGGD